MLSVFVSMYKYVVLWYLCITSNACHMLTGQSPMASLRKEIWRIIYNLDVQRASLWDVRERERH